MNEFDELNNLSEDELLDISDYFDSMELSNKEKEKRKDFAESINEIMLFIFTLFSLMKDYKYINKQFIISQLQSRYSEVILKFMDTNKYIQDYIKKFSKEVVDITLKYPDEEYYLSDDRAFIISVNEANSVLGYQQLQEAKEQGFTYKTWITEKDSKVRKTHKEVDNMKIPIDYYFPVGNSLMMYPHDMDAEPEETVNCRCTLKFS